MSKKDLTAPELVRVPPRTPEEGRLSELLRQYGCGPIAFSGSPNALYERHLIFDRVIDPQVAKARELFRGGFSFDSRRAGPALALTRSTYEKETPNAFITSLWNF